MGKVVPGELCEGLPLSLPQSLHQIGDAENIRSLISKNGRWVCILRDSSVNIFCTATGHWQGGHCFKETLQNPSVHIITVTELVSPHLAFPCLLLALTHDQTSLVCLFDIKECCVMEAVLVPERVTTLCVVSSSGGASVETHHLNGCLRLMFGSVAMGTANGNTYFLDLCLDEAFRCLETTPNITSVVRIHDFGAERRERAISRGQHIFMHLQDDKSTSSFDLPRGSNFHGRVEVTAIHYTQSLSTLAIGFNFGGFQLWDLYRLILLYTITSISEQSVVSFAFQEPENDPRHVCYLWVVRGHVTGEEQLPESESVACLYSLSYFRRDFVKGFGPLYYDLQTCNKRLEFPLTGSDYNSSVLYGSSLIASQVCNQRDPSHPLETSFGNDSVDSLCDNQSLCFFAWEMWGESNSFPASYHLAVFDLNQWYQAHMPSSVRPDQANFISFVGFFSLKEVTQHLQKPILSLQVDPQSIKKFRSLHSSDEFFYPSSLGFRMLAFSETNICKTTFYGIQKHLLYKVVELGPESLYRPEQICLELLSCGLITDMHGSQNHSRLTVQKEAILQLALENNLPSFFMKCLEKWKYNDSIHELCTSKSLLNWAWKKVISIKASIDKLSVPLFNCAGHDVDKASLKLLFGYKKQLGLIERIMAGYQQFAPPITEQGQIELQVRMDAVPSISLYLHVMLWLRNARVLPEACYESDPISPIAFPVEDLTKSYAGKRKCTRSSGLDASDLLLIDGLVKEMDVGEMWVKKGGSNTYPPPSVYAALSCYLSDAEVQQKHALFYYLLLDIAHCSDPADLELKKFPQLFGMAKSWTKLVEAIWHLDKFDCDLAIECLLSPSVLASDIAPWMHQRIIRVFLMGRSPHLALRFISHMQPVDPGIDYMRLCLSVFLSCGVIAQALDYQRRKQVSGFRKELLLHLFNVCHRMGKMRDLMNFPLNSVESSALVEFLSESNDPNAQESLIMYHLLHNNFFEAEKINNKLRRATSSSDAKVRGRSADRDALVEALVGSMPQTARRLVEEINRFPMQALKKKENILQPLSVSVTVKSLTSKKVTYSDILFSLLDRSSAINQSATPKQSSGVNYDDVPLLRSPLTPNLSKSQSVPVKENSGSLQSRKRSVLSSSPTDFSSPAQRSRLLDNATFKTPVSVRKTPRHLAGDIASLLQTPPIHRRVSALRTTPYQVPASILKKKADLLRAQTPPILAPASETSKDDSMDVDSEESAPKYSTDSEALARQIRFDLPVAQVDNYGTSVTISAEVHENVSASTDAEESSDSTRDKEMPTAVDEDLEMSQDENFSSFMSDKSSKIDVVDPMKVESPLLPTGMTDFHQANPVMRSSLLVSGIDQSRETPTLDKDASLFSASLAALSKSRIKAQSPDVLQRSQIATPRPPLQGSAHTFTNPVVQSEIGDSSISLQPPIPSSSFVQVNVPPSPLIDSDNEEFYSPCADKVQSSSFSQLLDRGESFHFGQSTLQDVEKTSVSVGGSFPDSVPEAISFTFRAPEPVMDFGDIPELDFPAEPLNSSAPQKTKGPFVFSQPVAVTTPENMPSAEHCTIKARKDEILDITAMEFDFANPFTEGDVLLDSQIHQEFKAKPSRKTFAFSAPVRDSISYVNTSIKASGKNSDETAVKPAEKPFVFAATSLPEGSTKTKKSYIFSASSKTDSTKKDSTIGILKSDITSKEYKPEEVVTHSEASSECPSEASTIETRYTEDFEVDSESKESILSQSSASKSSSKPDSFKVPVTTDMSKTDFNFEVEYPLKSGIDDTTLTEKDHTEKEFSIQQSVTKASKKFVFEAKPSVPKKASKGRKEAKASKSAKISILADKEEQPSESSKLHITGKDSSLQVETTADSMLSQSRSKKFVFTSAKEKTEDDTRKMASSKKSSGISDKKFVFRKIQDAKIQETGKAEEVFETAGTESYEQFFSTLQNKPGDSSELIMQQKSGKKARRGSTSSQKSSKGKTSTFSFAEPTSPATEEILKALSSEGKEIPVPSFLFSPPLTRGRLRQRTLEESMMSEMSFLAPMDPLLEGIVQERSLGTAKKSTRKTIVRKPRPSIQPGTKDQSRELSPLPEYSAGNTSIRHSMILRKNKNSP